MPIYIYIIFLQKNRPKGEDTSEPNKDSVIFTINSLSRYFVNSHIYLKL